MGMSTQSSNDLPFVLSLICNSSRCERNWSPFEMVHTKRRNHLKQKTMNDVVFVMANSRLAKKKQSRKHAEYDIDDLDSDEEWIVEDEERLDGIEDLEIPDDLNLVLEQDGGKVGHSNDLEIPDLDDDDYDNLLQREGNEDGGDHTEDEEYDDHNLMDLL